MAETTSRIDTIPRVELVDEVSSRLRADILAGRFGEDGEIPVEAELSSMFGVSRTVAREAMRMLRVQGLVEVRRGCKPRVKPADPTTVIDSLQLLIQRGNGTLEDLIEVRRPLEGEIAFLAAQRRTPAQLEDLQAAIDQQVVARSLKAQVEADALFHDRLAEASGNPIFRIMLTMVASLLVQSRETTIGRVGSKRAVAGHQSILAAVEEQNAEEARERMLEHLYMAKEDLA